MQCAVCGFPMAAGLTSWHWTCVCGHEASTLEPQFDQVGAIDEGRRAHGLRELRQRSFRNLADTLHGYGVKAPGLVLDVGCAHGWFLDVLCERGYAAVGIEPDAQVASGHPLARPGFFPDALRPGDRFDAVTFNDVFEHLSDINRMMEGASKALAYGGLLLINGPDSHGALYRVAKLLHRIGLKSPFERMWQVGLPSPHLSYFSEATLRRLAEKQGLTFVARRPLASITLDGLWDRITYTNIPKPVALAAYVFVVLSKPLLLDLLPSDTAVMIFRKSAGN